MKAVVLAAGEGSRMASAAAGLPKALVSVAGRPLLAHTLERLECAGFSDVVLVAGFQAETIEEFLKKVRPGLNVKIVRNPEYRRENGSSLLCVRDWVGERFVLAMGDHIVDPAIYQIAAQSEKLGLCIDRQPALACQTNDATRVWIEANFIKRIGKELQEWNAIDTGVFSLNTSVFDALELLKAQKKLTITESMRALIAQGESVCALDVTGKFWADLDTPDDLLEVEAILKSARVS